MLWVTILGIIIIPVLGWIINTVITKKIDKLQDQYEKVREDIDHINDNILGKTKEGFQTVFKRMDDTKELADSTYVRKDNYNLAREYEIRSVDEKFKSMLSIMNTQFGNMDGKMDDLKKAVVDAACSIKNCNNFKKGNQV